MSTKRSFVKVFSNTYALRKAVQMREEGDSYRSISNHFGCQHSAVIYHLQRLGVQKGVPSEISRRLQPSYEEIVERKNRDVFSELIHKSYV